MDFHVVVAAHYVGHSFETITVVPSLHAGRSRDVRAETSVDTLAAQKENFCSRTSPWLPFAGMLPTGCAFSHDARRQKDRLPRGDRCGVLKILKP
jgi:hypothetical protein